MPTNVAYPTFITKAKGKKKQHQEMNDIADAKMSRVAKSYRDGFDDVRDATTITAITKALKTGEMSKVVESVKWDKFEPEKADDLLALSLKQAAVASIAFVPVINNSDYTFDPRAPKTLKFLSNTTANRLELVTNSGREATRIMTFEAFDKGIPLPRASQMIRGSIGLNAKQARAVVNLRNTLAAEGLSQAKIDSKIVAYTKRALRSRSLTIAQTELTDVISQGQLDMWDQAVVDGVISMKTWEKVWVATRDSKTSRICLDLDGQAVPLNKQFIDPSGVLGPFDRPSAHPNCRSSLIIRRRKKK